MVSKEGLRMGSYNPWSSKEKKKDDQQQCNHCRNWDAYVYCGKSIKEKKKLKLCYQCFHQLLGNGQIEEVED